MVLLTIKNFCSSVYTGLADFDFLASNTGAFSALAQGRIGSFDFSLKELFTPSARLLKAGWQLRRAGAGRSGLRVVDAESGWETRDAIDILVMIRLVLSISLKEDMECLGGRSMSARSGTKSLHLRTKVRARRSLYGTSLEETHLLHPTDANDHQDNPVTLRVARVTHAQMHHGREVNET